jgi:hypothetical protein
MTMKLWFDSRKGQEILLHFQSVQTASGPTHTSIKLIPWALSPGVKRLEREADQLSPSSAEVKTE